jgi:hypothetical protein
MAAQPVTHIRLLAFTVPNNRIKTVRFAHSTVQELRTCTAFYAER